ncbi:hypothetical protein BC628DRAFT_1340963 [Trametes gibbosa]|nr:hypothetical protein BC628DRAFT_1340963 [Trametes gibbosa]
MAIELTTSTDTVPSSPRRARQEAIIAASATRPLLDGPSSRVFVPPSRPANISTAGLNRKDHKGKGVDRGAVPSSSRVSPQRSPGLVPQNGANAEATNAEGTDGPVANSEADISSPFVRPSRVPLGRIDLDVLARRFGPEVARAYEHGEDPSNGKDSGTAYIYPPPNPQSPHWLTVMEHGLATDGLSLENELLHIRSIADSALVQSTLAVAEIDEELREYEALLHDLRRVAGDAFVENLSEIADQIKLPPYLEDEYPADPMYIPETTENFTEYPEEQEDVGLQGDNEVPTTEAGHPSDTFSYLNPPTSPLAHKRAKRCRDAEEQEGGSSQGSNSSKRRRSKAPAPTSPPQVLSGNARGHSPAASEDVPASSPQRSDADASMSGHDITTPPRASPREDYPASFPTTPARHRASSPDLDGSPSSSRPSYPPPGSPHRRAQSCPLSRDDFYRDCREPLEPLYSKPRVADTGYGSYDEWPASEASYNSSHSSLVSGEAPCPRGWPDNMSPRWDWLKKMTCYQLYKNPIDPKVLDAWCAGVDARASGEQAEEDAEEDEAEGSGVDRSEERGEDGKLEDATDNGEEAAMKEADEQIETFEEQEEELMQLPDDNEELVREVEQGSTAATELPAPAIDGEPEAGPSELPVTPPRRRTRRTARANPQTPYRPFPSTPRDINGRRIRQGAQAWVEDSGAYRSPHIS